MHCSNMIGMALAYSVEYPSIRFERRYSPTRFCRRKKQIIRVPTFLRSLKWSNAPSGQSEYRNLGKIKRSTHSSHDAYHTYPIRYPPCQSDLLKSIGPTTCIQLNGPSLRLGLPISSSRMRSSIPSSVLGQQTMEISWTVLVTLRNDVAELKMWEGTGEDGGYWTVWYGRGCRMRWSKGWDLSSIGLIALTAAL